MKLYAYLLLFVVRETLACNLTASEARQQWKANMEPFEDECIRKTGTKREIIDGFYDHGIMSDDPSWKCFHECVGSKEHIFTSTGSIITENVVKNFACVDAALVKKCFPTSGPDACERAYLAVKCANDNLEK
ncbi:hypothetical protein ILUMI_03914 [Ignelater luminosus]|uniref:Uncharacterized protein n=1 Tax=Ignelater luminosus TaxID=2038154 RepID=A0A8K0DDT0_IGNLU|nr:hypothetical protein ILUMI_03914 [Ignelater luminosus]